MVAHAAFPASKLQETGQNGKLVPSSLSSNFVTNLLRGELDFDGVIISDDLEMGAIVKNYGIGDACKMAVERRCRYACDLRRSGEYSRRFYGRFACRRLWRDQYRQVSASHFEIKRSARRTALIRPGTSHAFIRRDRRTQLRSQLAPGGTPNLRNLIFVLLILSFFATASTCRRRNADFVTVSLSEKFTAFDTLTSTASDVAAERCEGPDVQFAGKKGREF